MSILIGAVAIGRNEGERLRKCIQSLTGHAEAIVYVDSGSTDQSVQIAEQLGAEVVHLDQSTAFTAARARNAGWRRLLATHPDLRYVQFVDGDCTMDRSWWPVARMALENNPDWAIGFGRTREVAPERSLYNRVCDLEWDTPAGPAVTCGGIALIRTEALRQVDGFRDTLIAGEEPEMCLRLRQRGWQIQRLDTEMCRHDADMTKFRQWWRRSVRTGHAFAEGYHLHRGSYTGYCTRECRSIWVWACIYPTTVLASTFVLGYWAWLAWLAYPMQILRTTRTRRRTHPHNSYADAFLYGTNCVLSKFPQLVGQIKYWWNWQRGRKSEIIEYKTVQRH